MATDIKQLARRLYDEVWSRGQLQVLDQILDARYDGYIPLVGKLDREGLKGAVQAYRKAFPDLSFQVAEIFGEGEKLIVHWLATGTSKAPFMNVPPSGTRQTVEGFTMMEFRQDHVVRETTQYDVIAFFKGLGIQLPVQMPARAGAESQPSIRH